MGQQSSQKKKEKETEEFKGIDNKLIELIRNEIIVPKCEISWEDIAGIEHAKKTIQEAVIWPMLRPGYFYRLERAAKGNSAIWGTGNRKDNAWKMHC